MRICAITIGILASLAASATPANAGLPAWSVHLDTLTKPGSGAAKLDAASKLAAVSPMPVAELVTFLGRKRTSSDSERRKVLRMIRAAVPDRKGRFRTPRRKKKKAVKAADAFDWLEKLSKLPASKPGRDEVIADVAVVRALAASKRNDAAAAVLDFAFDKVGIVYRDECGRYLRRMAPYSVPALIRATPKRNNRSRARYATYQLERLDRQSSAKALGAAAVDDALMVETLKAFSDVLYRDAVRIVLATVDHQSPRVRKAARLAWLNYAEGRPPRKAPKRKLKMAGNRLSDKEKPLWLTSRELARIELNRKVVELLGESPSGRADLGKLSRKLFAFYDKRRADRDLAAFDNAEKLYLSGDAAEAAKAFDRILAAAPSHPRRAEMAPAYLAYAKQLEELKKWRAAAAAYAKAHGAAPKGDSASIALAGKHYSIGRALTAEGRTADASFRRALEADPKHRSAAAALAGKDPDAVKSAGSHAKPWMLYGGIGGGAAALLLLALGLVLRRRG